MSVPVENRNCSARIWLPMRVPGRASPGLAVPGRTWLECREAAFRRCLALESRPDGQVVVWHPDSVRRREADVRGHLGMRSHQCLPFACLGCPESPSEPQGTWPTKNSSRDVGVCGSDPCLPVGKIGKFAVGGCGH